MLAEIFMPTIISYADDTLGDLNLEFYADGNVVSEYSETIPAENFEIADNGYYKYNYTVPEGYKYSSHGMINGYIEQNGKNITIYRKTSQDSCKLYFNTATDATNPTLTPIHAEFDGNPHEIGVIGGNGGTIYYKTSEDNSTWSSWSTTVPARTEVGTTYVKAYVKGDSTHFDTSETISSTITIVETDSTKPVLGAYEGTYDGNPHTVSVGGGIGGTIYYSTDNEQWSRDLPTRTEVGTTTVYAAVYGDNNHRNSEVVSSTITLNKKQSSADSLMRKL